MVTLERTEDDLVLTVSDRGVGFDPSATPTGSSLGLNSMRERMTLLDGTLTIESKKGAGTRLTARVPLQSRRPEDGDGCRT